MITDIIIYQIDTGEIKAPGGIQFEPEADIRQSQILSALRPWGEQTHALLIGAGSSDLHYVGLLGEQPVLLDRPPIPYQISKTSLTVDGEDFLTISGLHDPCNVVIDDPDPLVETISETVTGGSFEFAAETPGVYTIQITKFPFLPLTLEITAVPPGAQETSEFVSDFSFEFGS